MGELDEVLEKLEADNPGHGVKEAVEFYENSNLDEEQRKNLAYGIGVGYFKIGSYDKTLSWLDKTNDPRRWLLSGYALQQMDEFEAAARAFSIAAEKNPEQRLEAKLLEAQVLLLAEKIDSAAGILGKLLEEENLSRQMEKEALLTRARAALAGDKPRRARPWLEKVFAADSKSEFAMEAVFYLIQVEEKAGQITKALEYARWLKENGSDENWRGVASEYLRRLHGHRRNQKGALRDYDFL
ncbi:MAG: tetratricopeptide repeat protein [bacterium]